MRRPGHAVSSSLLLPTPATAGNGMQQQQLVAVVAHFPIELTIAVRLLTATISGPILETGVARWELRDCTTWQIDWQPYLIKCIHNVRPSLS